ncbi:mannose-specific lectin 3-like protein [Cinnamomum micranthum f. kanehirae]|uniref:Mannose-specific lectin 3-like protein n=1 Tax=Cinnamomum micranthum f. kanehirae TaxID=337451 RepID=A0A3S3QWH3_9MAGN|nr:mannose-specific lectin 3-like protein [Cinnamomum micranthum f. kanehirae]
MAGSSSNFFVLLILSLFVFLVNNPLRCEAGNVLYSVGAMYPGDVLQYNTSQLKLEENCNLVMPHWETNTLANFCNLTLGNDGDLVLYADPSGETLWTTNTTGALDNYVLIYTFMRLQVYGPSTWSSKTSEGTLSSLDEDTLNENILYPGGVLDSGESLKNGKWELVMRIDCNLTLYDNSEGKAIWSTNTSEGEEALCHLKMELTGDLVIYDHNHNQIWASDTSGNGVSLLVLRNDGDVCEAGNVLYNVGAMYPVEFLQHNTTQLILTEQCDLVMPYWQTHTSAAFCNLTLENNGELVLYGALGQRLWASNVSGSSGEYVLVQNFMQLAVYGPSKAENVLFPEHTLESGNSLKNGRWELRMLPNCNLVLYDLSGKKGIWSSKTSQGSKVACHLKMESTGDAVIYNDESGDQVWSSDTSGIGSSVLVLRNDGNLYVSTQHTTLTPTDADTRNANVLSPHETLLTGNSLKNAKWELKMQEDCDLVLYDFGAEIWSTGTSGKGTGCYLKMELTGDAVVYNEGGDQIWSSDTSGMGVSVLVLRNDGCLVVYGPVLWDYPFPIPPTDQSLDTQVKYVSTQHTTLTPTDADTRNANVLSPHETLLTGNSLKNAKWELKMQEDCDLVLYDFGAEIWSTGTSGKGTGCYLKMELTGDAVVYNEGGDQIWSSDTSGMGVSVLVLRNDGCLVVYGPVLWDYPFSIPPTDQSLDTQVKYVSTQHTTLTPTDADTRNANVLSPHETLLTGNSLKNAKWELKMQEDCDLVLYDFGAEIWSTGTSGKGTGCYLKMELTGDAVVYNEGGDQIWSSDTSGMGVSVLVLRNDGCLVVYGPVLWDYPFSIPPTDQSLDTQVKYVSTQHTTLTPTDADTRNANVLSPHETLLTGNSLKNAKWELKMQEDCDLVLYDFGAEIWSTGTSGKGTGCYLKMELTGDAVVYNEGGDQIWSSDTSGMGVSVLVLRNDGCLVVYGPVLWDYPFSIPPTDQSLDTQVKYVSTQHTTLTPTDADTRNANVLSPHETLLTGNSLKNAKWELKMQEDCDLVLYDFGAEIWSTGTSGKGTGCYLKMELTGDAVVYNEGGDQIWSSDTSGMGVSVLVLRNDGCLVVYGPVLWDYPFSIPPTDQSLDTQVKVSQLDHSSKFVVIPILSLLFFLVNNPLRCEAGNVLYSGGAMFPGDVLQYNISELKLEESCNLVMPHWQTNTLASFCNLTLNSDGELVLYDVPSGEPLWSSNKTGSLDRYVLVYKFMHMWVFGPSTWSTNTSTGTLSPLDADTFDDNTLFPGAVLSSGESLKNGKWELLMQSDCNLTLIDNSEGKTIWSTDTAKEAAVCHLKMELTGDLVIYDESNDQIWASNTSGTGESALVLQNDGDVVIYGPVLWTTGILIQKEREQSAPFRRSILMNQVKG